ncbi:hypothetical protein OQA88_10224 [Cercophora sp. LCS_1]
MSQFLGELLVQLIGRVIVGGLIMSVVAFVDRNIVPRRNIIVRRGRAIQNALHISRHICVFADEEPGMLDKDIRLAAEVLVLAGFFSNFALLILVLDPREVTPYWLLFIPGIVIPGCLLFFLWLYLVKSKRRLEARLRDEKVVDHGDGDPGVEGTFNAMFLS